MIAHIIHMCYIAIKIEGGSTDAVAQYPTHISLSVKKQTAS